jgi:hypothetical protein
MVVDALQEAGYAVEFPRLYVKVSRERLLIVRHK